MPLIVTVGHTDTGHASFPPTAITSGASTVFVEGQPAARIGDSLAAHGSPSPSPAHPRALASGSGTVFVEGVSVSRIGDSVSCGGAMASSNSTVSAGG